MEDVGLFYGNLVYFTAIWYIFPVLECCANKNLATLNLLPFKSVSFLLGLRSLFWG
jgi:hypothetical protein